MEIMYKATCRSKFDGYKRVNDKKCDNANKNNSTCLTAYSTTIESDPPQSDDRIALTMDKPRGGRYTTSTCSTQQHWTGKQGVFRRVCMGG